MPLTDLVNRISAQFAQPFAFIYNRGHVGEITASPEISNTVLNIVRGVLDFFVLNVKKDEGSYELEEARHFLQISFSLFYTWAGQMSFKL